MKTAIIGLGVIGRLHADVVEKYSSLAAVCDVREEALAPYAHTARYTDYKKMLDEVRPDAVHICTPHYLHAEMVIEALSRDISVLCEKPLCIRAEDIPAILEAEKHSRGQLGVCLQNRYNASNIAVKSYLEGRCVEMATGQVSWHRDAAYYASGDWRGKWDTEGGGVLINQALHTLDLMQWLCGMPRALAATTSNMTLNDSIEVEDTASIICRGGGSFNFYATVGAACDMPVEITLRAEGELIKLMPDYAVIGNRMEKYEFGRHRRGKECYGSGHEALISDFYDCIATGRRFDIDGAEGAKVIRLILAAYKSGGEWVDI